jgi:hypothetical protein
MTRWGKPIKNNKNKDPRYFLNESWGDINDPNNPDADPGMVMKDQAGAGDLEGEILRVVGSEAEAGMGISLENIVNNIDADPEAIISTVEAMAASGALYADGESYFLGDASAPAPSEDLEAIMEAKWKAFIGK